MSKVSLIRANCSAQPTKRLADFAARLSIVQQADYDRTNQLAVKIAAIAEDIEVVLKLSTAIRCGDLKLCDLKKLEIGDRIYQAIAELIYLPVPLCDLSAKEIIATILELNLHDV